MVKGGKGNREKGGEVGKGEEGKRGTMGKGGK